MTHAGQSLPHESARGHVSGTALYTDDLVTRFPHAWPVTSPYAHALVSALDASTALAEPSVVATLTASDLRGEDHPAKFQDQLHHEAAA